jgi:3-dehydroquinate synthase
MPAADPAAVSELRLRWGGGGDDAGGASRLWIGVGALAHAAPRLEPWLAGRTVFVVAQPPVLEGHGAALDALTAAAGRRVDLPVPDGEAAKTVAVAGELWRAMLDAGGKRDSRLVTFGGGSAGDLGGFVAGCFLRGVEYVQVPTTLLAQVDAAIGGKTAVDLPGGKNTVGLFHHPRAVVADTALLASLPRGELRSGLVEVVKMAFFLDDALLRRVEDDLEDLLAGDAAALAPVVTAAAAAKIGVVESDVREGGRRRLLNFGHTLGHAVESALGYRGLRHGEAVAYGILFALRLAEARGPGWLDPAAGDRLRRLLARLELPPLPADALAVDDLVERLGRDKKARESGVVWVLPASAAAGGVEGRMVTEVGAGEVRRHLAAFLDDPFAPATPRSAGGGVL